MKTAIGNPPEQGLGIFPLAESRLVEVEPSGDSIPLVDPHRIHHA